MTKSIYILLKHRHTFWAAILITIFLLPTDIHAQSDWWKKGKELLGGIGKTQTPSSLSLDEISGGLKEALRVGTANVVGQLGKTDGFNNDPVAHIPLPENLQTVKRVLDRTGMGSMVGDLELKLNRAAEAATPKAKKLFWQAISEMTLEDAKAIYNGPQDAATKYFESKMSQPLAKEMRPIVENTLSEVGAVQAYDRVMEQYRALPFVPDIKADLTNHVIDKGLAGIFHYLAEEEAAIRQNPAKRTTELLQRVFGAK